ncbi:tRNA (adenosine(37)-N6)-threonylcarbamoyltransferase complex dimerization subunit type 1 TsaB [Aeoliella mucimassa]|uniref:N(6)-L-threonylcarbamoyladenine synthase n=1 Tax=Aeoliella mucimassa TaxID=2527972 RepID=A0A518ASU3_9BACT|nr:tRNA (adenosine(37)-N6)-threonylcarbamoyltransferase complex dimerization subunit type 1 TsaB [Aeoliella mucimassa]QDU57790.1 tRNA threonylcarbamoyladenosine biosynthesis protein TsaB [Aeoliella mucimassa]
MNPPIILAIETSGKIASLALLEAQPADCQLLQQVALAADQRTAQALVPAMHQLLKSHNMDASQLGAIAVVTGPGSFTGLRIGVTAAKTLAYASETTLAGVNTLDTLAAQAPAQAARVWGVVDAQRGDLFAACYTTDMRQTLGESDPTQLLAAERWLEQLQPGDVVIGPAAARYAVRLPEGAEMAPEADCTPHAATVGQLGWQIINRQGGVDPFALVPHYHRLSAAEEKALAAKR